MVILSARKEHEPFENWFRGDITNSTRERASEKEEQKWDSKVKLLSTHSSQLFDWSHCLSSKCRLKINKSLPMIMKKQEQVKNTITMLLFFNLFSFSKQRNGDEFAILPRILSTLINTARCFVRNCRNRALLVTQQDLRTHWTPLINCYENLL